MPYPYLQQKEIVSFPIFPTFLQLSFHKCFTMILFPWRMLATDAPKLERPLSNTQYFLCCDPTSYCQIASFSLRLSLSYFACLILQVPVVAHRSIHLSQLWIFSITVLYLSCIFKLLWFPFVVNYCYFLGPLYLFHHYLCASYIQSLSFSFTSTKNPLH